MRGSEGSLLNFGKIISWIFIQFHHTQIDQWKFFLRPGFGQIEWIETIIFCLFSRHDLYFHMPFGKLAAVNSFYQVALRKIRIFTFHFYRVGIDEIFDALGSFEMKFHPYLFIFIIDETECMATKSIHMAVTIRGATIAHQEHDLVQAFRIEAPEIPHHRWTFTVGIRISFLGMNEIRKFFRILDKKDGSIISYK